MTDWEYSLGPKCCESLKKLEPHIRENLIRAIVAMFLIRESCDEIRNLSIKAEIQQEKLFKPIDEIIVEINSLVQMAGMAKMLGVEPVTASTAIFAGALANPVVIALICSTALWAATHPKQASRAVDYINKKGVEWHNRLTQFKRGFRQRFSPSPKKPWIGGIIKSTAVALLAASALIHGDKILDTSARGLKSLSKVVVATVSAVPKTAVSLTWLLIAAGGLYFISTYKTR